MHRVPVAVDTPQHSGVAGVLDYEHPQPLAPGTLVRVPLGRREVAGIVWAAGRGEAAPDAALRPVAGVLASLPPLAAPWLELADFAAAYYHRSVGELADRKSVV